jgi:hypothetical protein
VALLARDYDETYANRLAVIATIHWQGRYVPSQALPRIWCAQQLSGLRSGHSARQRVEFEAAIAMQKVLVEEREKNANA